MSENEKFGFQLPEGVEAGDNVMEFQLPLKMNPEAQSFLAKLAVGNTEVEG